MSEAGGSHRALIRLDRTEIEHIATNSEFSLRSSTLPPRWHAD
jgi:hypothetical protein